MKKFILISTVTLIISGCGSQYPEHNFVQSPVQPVQIPTMPVNLPTQNYGSKSVAEIKHDLAKLKQNQKITTKSNPIHIQPPPQIKSLASKQALQAGLTAKNPPPQKKSKSVAEIKQSLQQPPIPTPQAKTAPLPIAEIKQVLQENTVTHVKENALSLPMPHVNNPPPPIEKIKQIVQENTPSNQQENVTSLPMPHVKNAPPPIAKMKQIIEQNPVSNTQASTRSLPIPQTKSTTPSIATIKDFISDQPSYSEKKADKTVVIIQPNAKDGKPKAALKITNARNKIIASGKKLIGIPYLFGGSSRSGFDCSGLVQYVYKQHGINIPRTSRNQFSELKSVKQPQPGDLVFFRHGNRPVNHVGLYIGDNKMLHAPSTGEKVKIVDITSKYWQKRYAGARRVLDNNHLK